MLLFLGSNWQHKLEVKVAKGIRWREDIIWRCYFVPADWQLIKN